jgi:adenylate kinase family enzyme
MPLHHIHITGPSGAGVSTLGRALADRLNYRDLDTDDFYWLPSNPPYHERRPQAERLSLLRAEFDKAGSWVLSGSLMTWGDALIDAFDLVIFLYAPSDVRVARLARRERARFGAQIDPGGAMYAHHREFLAWAASYETGEMGGRSLKGHRDWLAALPCPVLELDATETVPRLLEKALAVVDAE